MDPGDDLLSHTKNHAVPSAQRSLTTEFGMGSGGAFSLRPPRIEVILPKLEEHYRILRKQQTTSHTFRTLKSILSNSIDVFE